MTSFRIASMAVAIVLSMFLAPAASANPMNQADLRDFWLKNDSSSVIQYVYVSAADQAVWGTNVLGYNMLMPGQRAHISFDPRYGDTCYYDLLVVTSGHQSGQMWGVDLCATSTVSYSDY